MDEPSSNDEYSVMRRTGSLQFLREMRQQNLDSMHSQFRIGEEPDADEHAPLLVAAPAATPRLADIAIRCG
eukprot:CAMPEP_0170478234 /NCGR_PEP_ID=MMETSP0123-20130129/19314_1 /TAXON_ID=182087 /ORGANISM="Favella ehrenbergii, Strain Fehren 1" /LENGTH=70 /DNA_ID=CAMNT_0010750399 /DNA_START=214 /DNA_END=426 /DNA_ORIENTATION=+